MPLKNCRLFDSEFKDDELVSVIIENKKVVISNCELFLVIELDAKHIELINNHYHNCILVLNDIDFLKINLNEIVILRINNENVVIGNNLLQGYDILIKNFIVILMDDWLILKKKQSVLFNPMLDLKQLKYIEYKNNMELKNED